MLVRHTDHLMLLYIPVICSAFILLYLKVYESKKIVSIFEGYFDLRAFKRVIREETVVRGPFANLLLFNSMIVIASALTFIVLSKNIVQISFMEMASLFGLFCLGLIGYYWLRKIIFFLIGYFTEHPSLAQEIQTYNKFYYQLTGIILLPILFFLNYKLTDSTNTLLAIIYNGALIILQGLIIFTYLLKLVQEFRQTSQIKLSGYYLFLYFCTLEILPLIVLIAWFIA